MEPGLAGMVPVAGASQTMRFAKLTASYVLSYAVKAFGQQPCMTIASSHDMNLLGRGTLLVGSISLGAVMGVLGQLATGSEAWFLAIPGLLAIGWIFVADPTTCEPKAKPNPSGTKKGHAP